MLLLKHLRRILNAKLKDLHFARQNTKRLTNEKNMNIELEIGNIVDNGNPIPDRHEWLMTNSQ